MFEDMVVSTSTAVKTNKPWTVILSFVFQASFLAILILIPLIYTEALPKTMMATLLVAPPPPPPPPPPPVAAQVVHIKPQVHLMDAGKLVDDATVLGMIRERLGRADALNGFILDGFPRNITQAEALKKLLEELGAPLESVVLLNLDLGVLFKRLTGRRICESCGRVFNIYTAAPGVPLHCEHCGGCARLIQRPDDKEEVIAKRLEVYEAQTKPLITYYKAAGLLRIVDADADMDSVFANIQRAVQGAPRVGAA